MKKVEAYIRHEAFEPIRTELLELGFPSLSITRGQGLRPPEGHHRALPRGGADELPRPEGQDRVRGRLDRDVQTVVDTILKHARTGSIGDGKVFVMPVEEAYRIRTGESGEETLQAHPDAAAEVGERSRWVTAAARSRRAPPPRRRSLVERCGPSTCEMVDAVLGGDGLRRGRRARRRGGRRAGRGRRAAARPPRSAAGRGAAPTLGACGATSARLPRSGRSPVPPGVRPRSPIVSGGERLGARAAARRAGGGRGRRVPPHRGGRRADRGRRRGGAGGRAEPRAARSSRSCARGAAWSREESCGARRALGCDLARGAVALCAELTTERPRQWWRRSPARSRGRWPSTSGARLRARCRPRRDGADGTRPRPAWRRACAGTGTVGVSSFYAEPGELGRALRRGRARARRAAPRRGAGGGEGPRHGRLPAAVPRVRVASRGGALVLRGHGRAARPLRRASTAPSSSRPSRRSSSTTAPRRDGRARSTCTATRSPTGSSG